MIVFNLLNLLIDNFLTFYIEQHAAQSIILPAYIYHTVVVMFTDQHAALHIILLTSRMMLCLQSIILINAMN